VNLGSERSGVGPQVVSRRGALARRTKNASARREGALVTLQYILFLENILFLFRVIANLLPIMHFWLIFHFLLFLMISEGDDQPEQAPRRRDICAAPC
jgi:hypothetical protein